MAPSLTLFVTIWSCFSNRVICYLRAKGIEDQVKIVEVDIQNKLSASGKPPGQIPILRIDEDCKEPKFITESAAIISYLETIFLSPRLNGSDAYEQATISSRIVAFDFAFPMYLIYLAEASAMMKTAIPELVQSQEAAKANIAFAHKYVNVFTRTLPSNGPLLTESQTTTIADIIVATSMQYIYCMYGRGMWENNQRLEEFWRAMKDKECMNHEQYKQNMPPVVDIASQLSVKWQEMTDSEKILAVDSYI